VCVCVCVWATHRKKQRERERERERKPYGIYEFVHMERGRYRGRRDHVEDVCVCVMSCVVGEERSCGIHEMYIHTYTQTCMCMYITYACMYMQ
jgi:hypothetical protein